MIGAGAEQPGPRDITSAVFTIRRDEPGGLHALLAPMAERGVNLTSIQLRPMPGKPWEYIFFVDLEGNRSDPKVAGAVEAAAEIAHSARVLGSFPRAERLRSYGED
ncbi:MAG: ACT domain-containing protein [Myxococcota bacterium]